ncbi:glutathione peroxidase [Paenibacillus montanisoli]|uniref:Glutathione peroxidase n=1 Tax=Paenibacillus montanisoli TaxID=2081970 RepID=A0A328TVL7_9BACL|nr:glutathione peroxidase [Paenibacillus montanisoli]RAP74539.1 glutathione peroxidase [Paenibacillus montanisoli]
MNVYDFKVQTAKGELKSLADYRGQVLLIVNTATKCGLTPQFKELQRLHETYKDAGLTVLGFPCNQFHQEPVQNSEMAQTCEINYGVTFPLLAKIDVNGPNADPLYKYLKKEASGFFGLGGIKWNFTKFLVDAEGRVVKRYSPYTKPLKFEAHIQKLLEQASQKKTAAR